MPFISYTVFVRIAEQTVVIKSTLALDCNNLKWKNQQKNNTETQKQLDHIFIFTELNHKGAALCRGLLQYNDC